MGFNHGYEVEVEAAGAEFPCSLVAVCAFEVGGCVLCVWRDVPASAAFVGDEWPVEGGCGVEDEGRVGEDGGEAVVDAESGAFEGGEER